MIRQNMARMRVLQTNMVETKIGQNNKGASSIQSSDSQHHMLPTMSQISEQASSASSIQNPLRKFISLMQAEAAVAGQLKHRHPNSQALRWKEASQLVGKLASKM
mmetsp:Transcript_42758/g.92991  ORF Transcript_42758/g.92991 Transcript_42758/m.92991 type:complete len:105 (-) Transcript_42758:161-475(-)